MISDEEFVRQHWERVLVCDGSYRHYKKGTILINWANHSFYEFSAGSWSKARAYTEQRLEEIRQVEREIHVLSKGFGFDADWADWCSDGPYVPDKFVAQEIRTYATTRRILARLHVILAELKNGMKASTK